MSTSTTSVEGVLAFSALSLAIVTLPALDRLVRSLSSSTSKKDDPAKHYIECPQKHDGSGLTIFLAGGISNCGDWQQTIAQKLIKECPALTIYNPRRKDFDVKDPNATPFQIAWEHDHLRKSSAILFWFPNETLCPITLYELGTWTQLSLRTGTKIFVGCDPKYQRIEDVRVQTKLAHPSIPPVVTSLDDLAALVIGWYKLQ